jgi:hypothetical protein
MSAHQWQLGAADSKASAALDRLVVLEASVAQQHLPTVQEVESESCSVVVDWTLARALDSDWTHEACQLQGHDAERATRWAATGAMVAQADQAAAQEDGARVVVQAAAAQQAVRGPMWAGQEVSAAWLAWLQSLTRLQNDAIIYGMTCERFVQRSLQAESCSRSNDWALILELQAQVKPARSANTACMCTANIVSLSSYRCHLAGSPGEWPGSSRAGQCNMATGDIVRA